MSNVRIQGNPSGSGTLTIAAPNTNSDRVLTLPDSTATLFTDAGGTLTGGLTLGGQLNLGSTGQIVFPATQNPSSNANTLDDYEEGTWTPTFGYSSVNPTVSYSFQHGHYVKVGRVVTITFDLEATSLSGGSGHPYIRGLPFVSGNLPNSFPVPTFRDCTAITTLASQQILNGFVPVNDNVIFLQFMQMGTAGLASGVGTRSFGGKFYAAAQYCSRN